VAIDKPRLLEIVQQHPLFAIELTRCAVRRLRVMNHLAQYDELTHLPNRTLFLELCHTALARCSRTTGNIGLLHLDIDHFENINDSLGYTQADLLLAQIATRLQATLHEADVLARFGADEFVMLVEGVHDETELAVIAQRLQQTLALPFVLNGQSFFLTASIGITCHPAEGNDVPTLLRNAASAMHQAKQNGRNQYAYFSAELNARALEFLTLKNELRLAIDRQCLCMHYQPRVALDTNQIHSVEALMRWPHPEQGYISPARFIPVAEASGLIDAIGEFALREGCRQRKLWLEAGYPAFRMAINLSALQMAHDDLVERVQNILTETGLPAELLELEITESALASNLEQTIEKLQALRALGIAIAIDDFGTGYSSLSYLKHIPLDCMKIDQSFVRGIPQDHNDVAITRTIIALAHNLGFEIVIEGVETPEQLEFARKEGCNEYQGYLYSKPLPPAELERRLAASQG
jgi:diguanylate cyclase (GGDEF)-like protein